MELDEESLNGTWSTDNKTGMDFFIINDAIFSKLCILGEDVEPCFEGASITAPEVSTSFTKIDDNFKNTLFKMMNDLKLFALKGGENMVQEIEETMETVKEEVVETEVNTEVVEPEIKTEIVEETTTEEIIESSNESDPKATIEEYSKKEEDKDKDDSNDKDKKDEDSSSSNEEDNSEEDEEDKKTKHSLEVELDQLKTAYAALEKEKQELVEFKNAIEDERKDTLINSFYMLSDEDKKDVIENKANYSYDEIEAKLSIICVRNKVNFDSEESSKTENTIEGNPAITYTAIQDEEIASVPAWVSAVKNTRDSRK